MKQLQLFSDCTPDELPEPKKEGVEWRLFIDGAARNNPGPAGAGIYLERNGVAHVKNGFFLGSKTNNQAEYLAFLLGIFFAKKCMNLEQDRLFIFSDSELMVRQCTGVYKIKKPELKILYSCAVKLLDGITYSICHVMREDNVQADALANIGIDKKVRVPLEFSKLLRSYDCHLL